MGTVSRNGFAGFGHRCSPKKDHENDRTSDVKGDGKEAVIEAPSDNLSALSLDE